MGSSDSLCRNLEGMLNTESNARRFTESADSKYVDLSPVMGMEQFNWGDIEKCLEKNKVKCSRNGVLTAFKLF